MSFWLSCSPRTMLQLSGHLAGTQQPRKNGRHGRTGHQSREREERCLIAALGAQPVPDTSLPQAVESSLPFRPTCLTLLSIWTDY